MEIIAAALVVGIAIPDVVPELFERATTPHKCGEEVANLLAFIPNQATAQEVVLLKMFSVFVAGGSRKQ